MCFVVVVFCYNLNKHKKLHGTVVLDITMAYIYNYNQELTILRIRRNPQGMDIIINYY